MSPGAAGENRTLDPTLTKGVLYHWATAANIWERTMTYVYHRYKIIFLKDLIMTRPVSQNDPQNRKDRLGKALRENLRKRKIQHQERQKDEPSKEPVEASQK
jgi:hypothetical protein